MRRDSTSAYRALLRDLWLELKIAADYSHGWMPEDIRATVDPPGWFKREHLGIGPFEGPSIFVTQHTVLPRQRANVARGRELARRAEEREIARRAQHVEELAARHFEHRDDSYKEIVARVVSVRQTELKLEAAKLPPVPPKRSRARAHMALLEKAVEVVAYGPAVAHGR